MYKCKNLHEYTQIYRHRSALIYKYIKTNKICIYLDIFDFYIYEFMQIIITIMLLCIYKQINGKRARKQKYIIHACIFIWF